MAYPSVRSVSSNVTDTTDSSIVCTHPAGLAEGDLMILFVGIYSPGSFKSLNTPSGWTASGGTSNDDNYFLICYKKIASSTDVSNGSTTVTINNGTPDKFGYGMYAITGAASGSEITLVETNVLTTGSGTVVSNSTTLTPLSSETLAISIFFVNDFDLSAVLTASSFSITPSITLTERIDAGVRDGASDGFSLFSASGEYAGTTEITSIGVTVSESINLADSISVLILVNASQSPSTNLSHLAVTPTLEGLTGSNTVTADLSHLDTEVEVNGITGKASSDGTQWTNEPKPTTNWTNEQK